MSLPACVKKLEEYNRESQDWGSSRGMSLPARMSTVPHATYACQDWLALRTLLTCEWMAKSCPTDVKWKHSLIALRKAAGILSLEDKSCTQWKTGVPSIVSGHIHPVEIKNIIHIESFSSAHVDLSDKQNDMNIRIVMTPEGCKRAQGLPPSSRLDCDEFATLVAWTMTKLTPDALQLRTALFAMVYADRRLGKFNSRNSRVLVFSAHKLPTSTTTKATLQVESVQSNSMISEFGVDAVQLCIQAVQRDPVRLFHVHTVNGFSVWHIVCSDGHALLAYKPSAGQ